MKKSKYAFFVSAVFIFSGGFLGIVTSHNTAHASGTVLQGGTQRKTQGSTYWPTSNIREWLNSDANVNQVKYTQNAPKYKNEAGFLNQFSNDEKNSMAIVKHQAVIHWRDADGGEHHGSANYSSGALINGPTLAFGYSDTVGNYGNWEYQPVNDKVWLPTMDEVYRLVESRGIPLGKTLTDQAKQKNQINNSSQSYWLNFPDIGMTSVEQNKTISNDPNNVFGDFSVSADDRGVAPIIALKPNTNVNGTLASNLKIGETISFGKYLNAPIKWTVINQTNGYPELFAQQMIDYKQFDNTGDYSQANSDYINFPTADADWTKLQVTATDGSKNTTLPTIKIKDDSPLYGRQNNPYTLHFDVTTSGAAFDHAVLPDGTTTTNSSFDYQFSENKRYVIKAYDKAGNVQTMVLPVSNINPPSSVLITPSTTDWSDKPVTVSVLANNQVGRSGYSDGMYSARDKGLYGFPNYTTYSGKKIHVKYTLTGGTPTSYDYQGNVRILLAYQALSLNNGQYVLNKQWVYGTSSGWWSATNWSDLANGKTVTKEATFDVPSNYNDSLSMEMHMDIDYDQSFYPYSISNFSVNLVDNNDFGVKSITLPNGKIVNSSSYTDTLTDNGTYTYKVLDSRGQTTTKTVTVKIDKENPTTTISGNPTAVVNQDVKLHATGTDTGGSGVSQMQSPQGEWVNGNSLDYTANQEGKHTYTFGVKDNAGNTSTKSVTVDIDKTAPHLSISGNPNSITHKPVELSASSTDDHSGVKRIQTPDGIWHSGSTVNYTVSKNGDYKFVVEDNAGNQTTKKVNVTQIGTSDYVSHDSDGSLVQSDNQTFGAVTLSGTAKSQDVDSNPLKFGDTKGNLWKLSVVASPFSNGSHLLPTGSLKLGNLAYTGPDQKLQKLLSQLSAIDKNSDIPVLQSTAGNSGEYLLDLDNSKFMMNIPANAYAGTYKTQITWKLQH